MGLMINGQSLRDGASGVRTYVERLADELAKQSDIDLVVLIDGLPTRMDMSQSRQNEAPWVPKTGAFYQTASKVVPLSAKKMARDLLSRYRRLPFKDWLYHEPNHVFIRHSGPKVLTVHDLSCLRYPEFHPPARVQYFNRYLTRSIKAADHIITPSNAIREEVIEHFSIDEDRITAVHLGVDIVEHKNFVDTKPPPQPYLLVVGAIEPRKNIGLVIEAFGKLPQRIKSEWKIVHAGPTGWRNDELRPEIQRLQEQGAWVELGVVSPVELSDLYRNAGFLAYPSIYEGFGLPPLEAMARGCPAIVSDLPVFREVCGDAVSYCAVNDAEHLASQMELLMDSPRHRAELVAKAELHWSKYRWAETAKQTLEIYTDVGSNALTCS